MGTSKNDSHQKIKKLLEKQNHDVSEACDKILENPNFYFNTSTQPRFYFSGETVSVAAGIGGKVVEEIQNKTFSEVYDLSIPENPDPFEKEEIVRTILSEMDFSEETLLGIALRQSLTELLFDKESDIELWPKFLLKFFESFYQLNLSESFGSLAARDLPENYADIIAQKVKEFMATYRAKIISTPIRDTDALNTLINEVFVKCKGED